ncbi:fructosamine kinase family protein [Sulfurimonas sp.]|uniref:fructosamine kinase family protein n=1 Tax=Sulfurimonas sp. TaxID=2022749 RepID=UPI0035633CA2
MEAFFKKKNQTQFKDSLLKEVDGLNALSKALKFQDKLLIPKIYNFDEDVLNIEMIQSCPSTKETSSILGKMLAKMHKQVYEHYGYNQDNYIGLNPQKNTLSDNWGSFFVEYRLGFQVSLIQDTDIKDHFHEVLDLHSKKLESFLNENTKHPSLVHGDLWSGNVMFDSNEAYLIDPAVYYGDREVDLAMTHMFGGFDNNFYNAYEKEYPLSKHYTTKEVLYNLYHYLNHYNLFGTGYLGRCEDGFNLIKSL